MKKLGILMCLMVLATVAVFASGGSEEGTNYPTKPVTCIIPFGPGGGSDIMTRAVMTKIKLPNDQPLIAVNTAGAGGMTGAVRAYNSPNDGYTILNHNPIGVIGYALGGQDTIPLWSELELIAILASDFNIVTTNKTAASEYGWKTIEDVVAWCKANPDKKIKWGTVGAQSMNMIDTKRIAEALGIADNITFVPFDGGEATRIAALANEIQLESCTASEIPALVKSGDNIPLMVINETRISSQPNTPTTLEKGINITTAKWRGYYAPKGTDPAIIKVLANAIKEVAEDPEFADHLRNNLALEPNFIDGPTAQKQIEIWYNEYLPYYK